MASKKGISSIPLFHSHNTMSEYKSGSQTKTVGKTSTIRGKQQHNRNTKLLQKQTPIFVRGLLYMVKKDSFDYFLSTETT